MSPDELLREAARNNALWCDAVCRAHGRPGEFRGGVCWLNRRETPPFYPNVVTLSDEPGAVEEQAACVRSLTESPEMPGEWAAKDSFHVLDLAPMGFTVLFSAEWLHLPAAAIPSAGEDGGLAWERVRDADALSDWETAWGGGAGRAGEPRIFLPPLLEDPDVALLAGRRDGRIVAGCVANRTGAVAGLSNVFLPDLTEADALRAGCVAAAADAFPGLPLVGYEAGDDLAAMKAVGFQSLGPLRVWLRRRQTAP